MEITKVKIILRKYPKEFEWEGIESWEKRINDGIKDLDVVAVRPIGMDGVLVEYMEDCPNNAKKIRNDYPISKTFVSGTGTPNTFTAANWDLATVNWED